MDCDWEVTNAFAIPAAAVIGQSLVFAFKLQLTLLKVGLALTRQPNDRNKGQAGALENSQGP
jgi:hypothetical protein